MNLGYHLCSVRPFVDGQISASSNSLNQYRQNGQAFHLNKTKNRQTAQKKQSKIIKDKIHQWLQIIDKLVFICTNPCRVYRKCILKFHNQFLPKRSPIAS